METVQETYTAEYLTEQLKETDEQLATLQKELALAERVVHLSKIPKLREKNLALSLKQLRLARELRKLNLRTAPVEPTKETVTEPEPISEDGIFDEAPHVELSDDTNVEVLNTPTLKEKIKNMHEGLKEGVMKFFSDISPKREALPSIKQTAKTLLLSGAFIATAFTTAKHSEDIKRFAENAHGDFKEWRMEGEIDQATYDQLPEQAKEVYLSYVDTKKNYIIANKAEAELILIDANNKLIDRIPALFGKDKSERDNLAKEENDWQLQPTSPAGRYTMGFYNLSEADMERYGGNAMRVYMKEGDIGVHPIYPGEFDRRKQALDTETISDNFITGGCINVETYTEHIEPYYTEGSEIFILPMDKSKTIDPETGKIKDLTKL